MRIVAIIQARMGSTRFPGKVLADLAGYPILRHVMERVAHAKLLERIIVAVPANEAGIWEMAKIVKHVNGDLFRDSNVISENDLIGRFYRVADFHQADLIVRLCADNPCVEPSELDRAVDYYRAHNTFFVSNMHSHSMAPNQYPDGIGCEVFSMSQLRLMHETITDPELREHPHLVFHRMGRVASPLCPIEFARPDIRLDVNMPEDLARLNRLYAQVGGDPLKAHITQLIEAWDMLHVADRDHHG